MAHSLNPSKTTISQQLKQDLPNSVFLDGDWCWDSNPFHVTEETKVMVVDNICHLLNNFIHCSAYENIIFCWGILYYIWNWSCFNWNRSFHNLNNYWHYRFDVEFYSICDRFCGWSDYVDLFRY